MTLKGYIRRHRNVAALIGLFVLLTTSNVALAQMAGGGSIQGTITDPSGSVIRKPR